MNDIALNASGLPPLPGPAYKDRRGWLIAFGIVEILIACFFLLMCCFMALVIPNMPRQPAQPEVPSGLFLVMAAFYGIMAAIFAAASIGSIRCRNWARILMIVLSSLWLAFGVLGTVGFIVVMPMILRQQETILRQNPAVGAAQLPPNFMTIVMAITIVFQVFVMVLLPLIFLIFYTRKNVKATCLALAAPATSSTYSATPLSPGAPAYASAATSGAPAVSAAAKGLPVPIVIAIVCFLVWCLSKLFALWLPITLLFGVTLRGVAARLVVLAFALVDLYCAWNFYKLRLRGWWVAIGFFVFSLLSGIVTLIRVDLRSFYDEVYRQMGMNPQQVSPYALGFDPRSMHFLMALGWLIWGAFFVFLVYTKRYFPANSKVS
ncbi:MAG: hypothetical protein DMG67_02255 [Acidobacteria bacterium]|nr:MAG: hypothetical protein DMG67_02255 [Acidobacteriota bacterium]